MQTSTLKLYSPGYTEIRTYWLAAIFVIGNLLLPQIAHLVPKGGLIFLPIYFFTLVGAYKYGWKVGLLTAILSPIINSALFGMPPVEVLPAIMVKSVFLVGAASLAAAYFKRISIPILLLVVLAYQVFGTLIEWALCGEFGTAIQDFKIGLPGMLVQILGGYAVIKYLLKK